MGYESGLYTGLTYFRTQITNEYGQPIMGDASTLTGVNGVDAFINNKVLHNQQDAIVSVFMIPHEYAPPLASNYPHEETYDIVRPTSLDGYTPRNKKLLTYPYNFLNIDTLSDSKNYRWEYARELGIANTIRIGTSGSINPNFKIAVFPIGYDGSPSGNFTEAIMCDTFEQCPFVIDAYRAWLAQRANGQMFSAIGSVGAIATGALTASPFGIVNGIVGLASSINSMVVDSTKGSKARGGMGGGAFVALKTAGIYAKKMCLRQNYAMSIDDFFDRYGYETERIKIPNRNVRPYWNYTKTKDCSIHGNMPAEAITKLKSIYDNGITFWKHTANVGDYTQNNTV